MSLLLARIAAAHRSSGGTSVTLNPADKDSAIALSGSNMIATRTGGLGQGFVRATAGFSSGKIYWEVKSLVDGVNDRGIAGMCLGSVATNVFPSNGQQGYVYDGLNGSVYAPSGVVDNAGTYTSADVIMMAFDVGGGNLWLGKNGTWFNNLGAPTDPATGTRPVISGIGAGPWFPCIDIFDTSASAQAMFAVADQTYAVPSGFSPVST